MAVPSTDNPFERATAGIPRRRWRIAWLLGAGVIVSYFDRVNLTVSHDALVRSFGLSAIAFGYLAGAYNWTYALCQLPIGVLLDRFGVRPVVRLGILLWSAASFAAGLAPGVPAFLSARLLLGVGEAPVFPANAKAIGLWFPAEERSLATAMFDASAKLASAIGVPLIGLLLLHIGWRWSFAFTGGLSLVYFFVFAAVYRDPDEDASLSHAERALIDHGAAAGDSASMELQLPLGDLLQQPKVIGLALGFGAYNYVFYLLLTWLPVYLSSAMRVSAERSFLYTGVAWLVAAAADLLVGGWLADALIQRGRDASRVRSAILIGGTTCGLGILVASHVHAPVAALFWISVCIAGLSAAAPIGWSIPSLIVPRGSVGAVGGIVNFSNQLSGIAAPVVTGYLVARHGSFSSAFAVAAAYLVVGILSYVFLLGRIEAIRS